MMKMQKRKELYDKTKESGMSLVEISVAMLVGITVFGFAIAFLVSFSSASYQAGAKTEVTQKARIAMTRTLKDVASASNRPKCVQWNNADSSTFTLPADIDKCVELISTGEVLIVAKDSALCWNMSETGSTTTGNITYPKKYACIFIDDGWSDATCRPAVRPANDLFYYSECNIGSTTPVESRIIAEIGLHDTIIGNNIPDRALTTSAVKRIFTYIKYDSTPFSPTNPDDKSKVLKVSVNITFSYENGKYEGGLEDYDTYNFSQTIQLAGMKAFLETGAYGN